MLVKVLGKIMPSYLMQSAKQLFPTEEKAAYVPVVLSASPVSLMKFVVSRFLQWKKVDGESSYKFLLNSTVSRFVYAKACEPTSSNSLRLVMESRLKQPMIDPSASLIGF